MAASPSVAATGMVASPSATAMAPVVPAAPAMPPASSNSGPSQGDLQEMQQVATADRLLGSDPASALAIVRACEARFPHGYMAQERSYVAVMALFALGRRSEARAEAARFLRDHPEGTFGERIRAAMENNPSNGR
jgi:hypothetical protein